MCFPTSHKPDIFKWHCVNKYGLIDLIDFGFLPICDDRIRDRILGIIIGCSYTGLKEDLSVFQDTDWGDLHVDLVSNSVLQWVAAGISNAFETTRLIKLKLVAEWAEASLCDVDGWSVSIKPCGDAALFLVLAHNFNFKYIFPGYDVVWIIVCNNCVFEEEMFIRLLQRNKYKCSLDAGNIFIII